MGKWQHCNIQNNYIDVILWRIINTERDKMRIQCQKSCNACWKAKLKQKQQQKSSFTVNCMWKADAENRLYKCSSLVESIGCDCSVQNGTRITWQWRINVKWAFVRVISYPIGSDSLDILWTVHSICAQIEMEVVAINRSMSCTMLCVHEHVRNGMQSWTWIVCVGRSLSAYCVVNRAQSTMPLKLE